MATQRLGKINIGFTVPQNQLQLYNALGRTTGADAAQGVQQNQGGGDNFFAKRGRSIENAFGTTGSAIASAVNDRIENDKTTQMLKDNKTRMNAIAKKYGYNTYHDVWDARDKAKAAGDTATLDFIDNTINPELTAQANENAAKANEKAARYEDYRKNDYISNKINQDRGKFAGSAINTLSTAVDVAGLGANPLSNAIQGGIEGVADELEQNGFENFDWGRAGQNAAIGATTGAVTGALNAGISGSLAKRAAKGLTNTATKAGIGGALKNGARTIATGAARGALSGAVGGATGAGLQSAMNGVEFGQGVQNALQGAVQGAQQGAVTGGIMAGANAAFGKTNFGKQLQNAKTNWDQSGSNFDERLTNTLTSGDSAVGDWLMNKRQSNVLGAAGNLGNSVQDVSGAIPKSTPEDANVIERAYNEGNLTPKELVEAYENGELSELALTRSWDRSNDAARNEINANLANSRRWSGYEERNKIIENYLDTLTDEGEIPTQAPAYGKYRSSRENAITALREQYSNEDLAYMMNAETNPKIRALFADAGGQNVPGAVDNVRGTDTPTTAKGWAKKASQRIVEDINNSNLGNRVKDVSSDMPEDIRNMRIRDYNVSQNNNGPTPSGLDKVTKAFDESANQRVLTNRGGKDFALGEFGSNNLQRKVNAQHNLSEADIKNIIDTSDRQSVSGDSSFRKDNVAWFGDLPNGERGTVITRLNSLGQEEVINAYKNNPGYEAELLKTYGTPAQSRTGSLGLEDLGDESATQGRSSIIQQNRQNVNLADPWDRVAQEAGYSNYDEVLQRYAEANPNAKINPRGMAGQVLTWMDQNPNTPTTASEWAKRAGQRAAEDINNSNLGLRVQDVSQDDPSKQLYNALAGNRQPVAETEVETEADMGTIPSKTSKESKLRYARGKELVAQYGTVDAPMARATNAVKTFQRISDMGFEDPTDVEFMANAITGSNGYVSTLNRNIIKSAKPVDTFTGDGGQTLDEFIDNSIAVNKLSGLNEGVAVKRSIDAYLKSLPSRAEGSVDYKDSAADTFKVVQGLEASAAELEGRGGSTYHRADTVDLHQAAVLKDVANLLKNRIYDGSNAKIAITPQVVKEMKALAPDNEKWSTTVDDFAKNVKTPQDLRRFQEPFVKAGRYIDNQYVQAATVGGRMAANAGELPSTLRTTKAGIINDLVNRAWNSNMAHRGRAALYGKLADRAAEKATNNPTTAKGWAKQAGQRAAEDLGNTNLGNRIQNVSGQPVNPQVASPAELANAVADYNPSTQLYNAIGRTEGTLAQEAPAQYLANAAQEAEIVSPMEAPTAPTNDIATNMGNTSTATYDALTGMPTTVSQGATNSQTNTSSINTGYFQPTGDYWTDIIASAMSAAIDTNDAESFSTLLGMYQNQMANLQKQTSSEKDYSNPMNWSSADRTKLLSAQNAMGQIDQLEEAYNQATGGEGSNAIQGWLRSRASDISGGNWDPSASNYNSLAESVGMGIVKNLINLGVTEADAQRYLKYLPALTDTKEQAAQKLDTLRSIYQNQINNLYGTYGL